MQTLARPDLDGIGEFVDSGRTVMLGVVASTGPERVPSAEELAKWTVSITDRLGFARSLLRERLGITPACGLAGATPQWARKAIELTQQTANAIAQDPDAI
jgi:methionine synthase II (cobalamin-independent)